MRYRFFFAAGVLVLLSFSGLSYSGTPEIIDMNLPDQVAVGDDTVFSVDVFHRNTSTYDLSLRVEDLGTDTVHTGDTARVSPNQTRRLSTEFTVQSPVEPFVNEKRYRLIIYGEGRDQWDSWEVSLELGNRPEEFLNLSKGWNMISSSKAFKLSELTDDCSIQEFRGDKLWGAGNSSWTHGDTVLGSKGYYVKAERNCVAEIENYTEEGLERKLYQGWNLVSVTEPVSLENALGDCTLRKYSGEPVWHYDSGNWTNPSTSATLEPTKGYFVNAEDSCQMSGATPPAPE